ncbi:hypothetical protein ACVWZA_002805 [Sphingomonas sp. UYAg733]
MSMLLALLGGYPAVARAQTGGIVVVDRQEGSPGATMSLPMSGVTPAPALSAASRAAAVAAAAAVVKPGGYKALQGKVDIQVIAFTRTAEGVTWRKDNLADPLSRWAAGCTPLAPEDLGVQKLNSRAYFLIRLNCPTLEAETPVRLLTVGVDGAAVRTLFLTITQVPFYQTAQPARGAPGDRRMPLRGGPWDGLTIGDVVSPGGKPTRALEPSSRDASPLPPAYAPAVANFLKDYGDGLLGPSTTSVDVGPNNRACRYVGNTPCVLLSNFQGMPFDEKCVPNAPYYLRDSDRVRIEWMFNGKLYYITWLSVRHGKIIDIGTAPADIPYFRPN